MKEAQDENLTFKPVINRKKIGTAVQPSTVGMQKYMERIEKAKKLKQEKQQIEDKVFAKGKKWTPTVTQPNAPKLTAKKNSYLTGNQMQDKFNLIADQDNRL